MYVSYGVKAKYGMDGCILLVQKQHIYLHGVYAILIKRYDKLLYSDQQGLTKLKTNKQLFVWAYHIRKTYIFGSGRKFSPSRNFQQGFLSFCKNNSLGYLSHSLDKLKRFTVIFATTYLTKAYTWFQHSQPTKAVNLR